MRKIILVVIVELSKVHYKSCVLSCAYALPPSFFKHKTFSIEKAALMNINWPDTPTNESILYYVQVWSCNAFCQTQRRHRQILFRRTKRVGFFASCQKMYCMMSGVDILPKYMKLCPYDIRRAKLQIRTMKFVR